MSAYLVSDAHINVLVAAAVACGLSPENTTDGYRRDMTATEIGRLLLLENMRSLAARYRDARYRDAIDETHLESYRYAHPSRQYSPVEILKACHCYAYQACEHPEWETSEALQLIRDIERATIHKLPGYFEAAWGIES